MDSQHFDSAPARSSGGAMPGFDAEFADIVDFIERITYRIWEGKQVGLIYDYYSEDCPVYTLAGYSQGADQVVQNTLRTLGAFPDRSLRCDNVIWGGDAQSGFHSSHLITSHMTNLGFSEFGAATGKSATIQVIAHCVCRDNHVIEEWLVRDSLSLAQQLGIDPQEWARRKARVQLNWDNPFRQWQEFEFRRVCEMEQDRAAYPSDDNERLIAAGLQNIWNARLVGDTQLLYAADAVLHASARPDITGIEDIARFYMGVLATLPDARVSIDYTCHNSMRTDADYVAARWTLAGHQLGGVLWGEPTGVPILVIGESQYRMVEGKILEEWLVFDELAVLTQVYRAR